MIYLFLNCDEYLIAQSVSNLKARLGDPEMADLNMSTFNAPQAKGSDILGQASMMPFLALRRLVMAYGYLSHLDKRAAASKKTDSAAHAEASEFFAGLAEVPDSCDLAFFEEGLDKRRHIFKGYTIKAKKGDEQNSDRKVPGVDGLVKAGVIELQELKAPDHKYLAGYVAQRAKQKEIAIEGRAVRLLSDYVGVNLRQLDNELDKLATYARGRTITEADIQLLVSDASEALIWDLTDALSQRNGQHAMRALYELRRGDANPFYLLTMIARQYRIIIKVKEATSSGGGNEYDIAKQVKESSYPVKKAMQLCRKYSFDQLTKIMQRLLDADFAMKTGTNPETEIDVLIAELTQPVR
ncbi:MAG: DNA polymerase III subunit delta [Chloroflexota bacterium]